MDKLFAKRMDELVPSGIRKRKGAGNGARRRDGHSL